MDMNIDVNFDTYKDMDMKTNRCILERIMPSDYEDVKRLYQDENVRRFLGGTVDDVHFKPRFDQLSGKTQSEKYWVIRHLEDYSFIGLISLDPHHDGDAFELSYQLLPQFWGAGYATEVSRAVLQYGFKALNLDKIVAETQAANTASRKLLEKLGMTLVKTLERFGEMQCLYELSVKDSGQTMAEYYGKRAGEYEKIYNREDSVRQGEQRLIAESMRTAFTGKTVLEVACGTGYWTERYAGVAKHVVATDLTAETLEIAKHKNISNAEFQIGDAYKLEAIAQLNKTFDAACANFWFSHVPKARLDDFLKGLHQTVSKGATVILADNVFVEGVGGALIHKPGESDTYKIRTLEDGTTYEILKNYFSEVELRSIFEPYAANLDIHIGKCFWWLSYQTKEDER